MPTTPEVDVPEGNGTGERGLLVRYGSVAQCGTQVALHGMREGSEQAAGACPGLSQPPAGSILGESMGAQGSRGAGTLLVAPRLCGTGAILVLAVTSEGRLTTPPSHAKCSFMGRPWQHATSPGLEWTRKPHPGLLTVGMSTPVGRSTAGKVAALSRAYLPSSILPRPQPTCRCATTCAPATCAGFIWDEQGHVVTNYHVLLSSLKGLGAAAADPTAGGTKAPPRIAKVRCGTTRYGTGLHSTARQSLCGTVHQTVSGAEVGVLWPSGTTRLPALLCRPGRVFPLPLQRKGHCPPKC